VLDAHTQNISKEAEKNRSVNVYMNYINYLKKITTRSELLSYLIGLPEGGIIIMNLPLTILICERRHSQDIIQVPEIMM
jgi:hypothetical protein